MTDTVNVPREVLEDIATKLRSQAYCSEANLISGGCNANLARITLSHFTSMASLVDYMLAAAPKAEPVSDPDDIETLISDAISDSMDIDWTSRDGARAVMRALAEEGVLVDVKPEAPKVELEPDERDLDILARWANGKLLMHPERIAEIVKRVLLCEFHPAPASDELLKVVEHQEKLLRAICDAPQPKYVEGHLYNAIHAANGYVAGLNAKQKGPQS